jgi:sortase (surface protein transpeptidase)
MLRRRTVTWLGASLLAGSVALAVGATSLDSGPATDATAATIQAAPSTVRPLSVPAVDPSTTAGTAPSAKNPESPIDPAPSPTSTVHLSPLAALVGAPRSAAPPPVIAAVAPAEITIDDIGVAAPIIAVGVQTDGQLEIPDEHHVGWYALGAHPGQPGATVLAAHVNWHHIDGPFAQLPGLEPGSQITLALEDGSTRTYEVVERAQYDKATLPAERIWTHDGPETLVLITCGGSFNADIRRYRDNVVVYAVPVGAAPSTTNGA